MEDEDKTAYRAFICHVSKSSNTRESNTQAEVQPVEGFARRCRNQAAGLAAGLALAGALVLGEFQISPAQSLIPP